MASRNLGAEPESQDIKRDEVIRFEASAE